MKQEIQKERISGFKEFADEVRNGLFPDESHVIKAEEKLIETFLKKVDK